MCSIWLNKNILIISPPTLPKKKKKKPLIAFNLNVSLFKFEEVGLPINLLKFDSYIAYFELKCRCLFSVITKLNQLP